MVLQNIASQLMSTIMVPGSNSGALLFDPAELSQHLHSCVLRACHAWHAALLPVNMAQTQVHGCSVHCKHDLECLRLSPWTPWTIHSSSPT